MGNIIITSGLLMFILSIAFNFFEEDLPTLPGDILMKKQNLTVYIPITTSIVISVLITIVLNLINRFF